MGWIGYYCGHGKIDRRAEANRNFDLDRYEVLKSSCVGSTVYSAILDKETGKCFAYVILTRIKDGWFYYKDIHEDMGPAERECPVSILNLLSPTDAEWAKEWRDACRINAAKKQDPLSLRNLPVGAKICWNGFVLVKMSPAYQFKRAWWYCPANGKYVPRTRIKKYEIVEEKNREVTGK